MTLMIQTVDRERVKRQQDQNANKEAGPVFTIDRPITIRYSANVLHSHVTCDVASCDADHQYQEPERNEVEALLAI